MTSLSKSDCAKASSFSLLDAKMSLARSYAFSITALTSSSMMRAVSSLYGLVNELSPRLS